MTTLVDANVILDLVTDDPAWADWSERAMSEAAGDGLAINPIIYAEVGVRFPRREDLDLVLPERAFARLPLPWDAAHAAGQAFLRYRRRGGANRSPLPCFSIGAHAMVAGMRLITRDESRYRTYFPSLALITP